MGTERFEFVDVFMMLTTAIISNVWDLVQPNTWTL